MKHIKKTAILFLALGFFFSSSVYSATRRMNSELIVPSRYTIVQLSFDIVALRGVELISYEKNEQGKPVLYHWNWIASQWDKISLNDLATHSFMKSPPREVFLIGSDRDLPMEVAGAVSDASKVVRIKTLSVVPVINTLNKSMKFTQGEWEALAKKHHFKIKDWNYERRRWGRYGPPNKTRTKTVKPTLKTEEPAQEKVEVIEVNEVVVEPSEVPIAKPATAPEEKTTNPFEEMEKELDKMSKKKAEKGVEMIPVKPVPAPDPIIKEKPPEIKSSDLVPLDLPPDNDLLDKGSEVAPEDK